MYEKYNLKYLNELYKKYGNWDDVAAEFEVDRRTIYRWRQEAVIAQTIENTLKEKITRIRTADSLELTVDALNKILKKYGIAQDPVCTTEVDLKKEQFGLNSWDAIKERTATIDFVDSIGYDILEFTIDHRFGIFFFNDLHVGNRHTNHQKIIDNVETVSGLDNVLTLGVGDYCDNYEKERSGSTDQIMSIPEQKGYVKQIFMKLKGKVLGVLQGCHDEWMHQRDEFDLSGYLAKHSDSKPMGFGCLVIIHCGEQTYKLFIRHKIHGLTPNSSATVLKKILMNHGLADIDMVIIGHWHDYKVQEILYRDKPIKFVILPSYKLTDRWLDQKGFPKSPQYFPLFIFGKEKHEILITTLDNGEEYL